MPPSPPSARLTPEPGRLPWIGHGRFSARRGAVELHAAWRVAAGEPPGVAWAAVRAVARALEELPAPADRRAALRRAWTAFARLPAEALGPARGADLSLLLFARDPAGVAITGAGLAALWARIDGRWTPLVPPDHPLLAVPPGRAPDPPGVLSVGREVEAACARPVGVPADGAGPEECR